MPRSIWTGAISFGLVNVPVKLYSAVQKKSVRFHQLHEKDSVRIQMKRVCPQDGEEVPYEDIVKGYEISPDRYVVVTNEELEALDPKKTKTIEIAEFVDLEDIDPIYFDHPYYLLPDKAAAKPYKLLVTAMRNAGKVAIARVVIRTKEQLVAIRATDDILTMATMNFADEIVPHDSFDEAPGDDVDAAKKEVDMARQLIESLSSDFDPEQYHDEYRERVLELIEKKAEGEEIVLQPAEEPEKVPDLMAALEASVAAAREPSGKAASDGKRRRRAASEDGAREKRGKRGTREKTKK